MYYIFIHFQLVHRSMFIAVTVIYARLPPLPQREESRQNPEFKIFKYWIILITITFSKSNMICFGILHSLDQKYSQFVAVPSTEFDFWLLFCGRKSYHFSSSFQISTTCTGCSKAVRSRRCWLWGMQIWMSSFYFYFLDLWKAIK